MKSKKNNKYKEKNKFFWKKHKFYKFYTPDNYLFRLISNKKINFINKNILDIGIGIGSNLIEFHRRGAIINGIDIKPEFINFFKKKFSNNDFHVADLNDELPKIKKKMSLILCKDTFYYFEKTNHNKILNYCNNLLNNRGYMILTFIEKEFKTNKKTININDLESYKINQNYHEKGNLIQFLNRDYILGLIKKNNFKLIESFFTIDTHFKKGKNILLSRILLLRKI